MQAECSGIISGVRWGKVALRRGSKTHGDLRCTFDRENDVGRSVFIGGYLESIELIWPIL